MDSLSLTNVSFFDTSSLEAALDLSFKLNNLVPALMQDQNEC